MGKNILEALSSMEESLTEQEKVRMWHEGTRIVNIKACSLPKLRRYYQIACENHYDDIIRDITNRANDIGGAQMNYILTGSFEPQRKTHSFFSSLNKSNKKSINEVIMTDENWDSIVKTALKEGLYYSLLDEAKMPSNIKFAKPKYLRQIHADDDSIDFIEPHNYRTFPRYSYKESWALTAEELQFSNASMLKWKQDPIKYARKKTFYEDAEEILDEDIIKSYSYDTEEEANYDAEQQEAKGWHLIKKDWNDDGTILYVYSQKQIKESADLKKLASEEADAIQSYEKEILSAESEEEKELLTHIKGEEEEHLEELTKFDNGEDVDLDESFINEAIDDEDEDHVEDLLDTNTTKSFFDDSVNEDIEKHNTLNRKLFDENNQLKPEVRDTLLNIANDFIEDLKYYEIPIKVDDIIITGSNCAYNYTKDSDIDLHIVADITGFEGIPMLYLTLYNADSTIWNKNHDITIYDTPLEIYVNVIGDEEVEKKDKLYSNGIYSVMHDGWKKEPVQEEIPDIDMEQFEKDFQIWEDRYDELMEDPTDDEVEKLLTDIYNERREGISEEGEYSIRNLLFKEFRNRGYLDKLKELKNILKDKKLSL